MRAKQQKRPDFRRQGRAAAWIGYYRLLPDFIEYFPYSFKIHEIPGGKNVWK